MGERERESERERERGMGERKRESWQNLIGLLQPHCAQLENRTKFKRHGAGFFVVVPTFHGKQRWGGGSQKSDLSKSLFPKRGPRDSMPSILNFPFFALFNF
jgi:hypothetical protein